MQQYYRTGDRRVFEVCRQVAERIVERQEPCGIYSNRHHVITREFTAPLANLLEFYQATWEWKYGELARRTLDWLAAAMPTPGHFPLTVLTAGTRGNVAIVDHDKNYWGVANPRRAHPATAV